MAIESDSGSDAKSQVVDIWLTRLSDVNDKLRHAYRSLLNSAEIERLERFLVDDARDQFLVARALLRTVLSRYADVSHEAWSFGANAYGKPHIIAPLSECDLHFNLSHTKGLVACAVSCGHEIGVDVENLRSNMDYAAFMTRFFAQAEISAVNQMPPAARRKHFYSLWTLKEAYIKARGMGLALPLDGFWFDLDGSTPRVHFTERCPDMAAHWRFFLFAPTSDHMSALAIAAPSKQKLSIRLHWAIPLSTTSL